MKMKKGFKYSYLFFLTIISIIFLVIERNHDCSGEGCTICLLATIIKYVTNILLVLTLVPILKEKFQVLFDIAYSNIIDKEDNKEENNECAYNYFNEESNLVTFGVKIQ